jgi:uncharacterized protein YukE
MKKIVRLTEEEIKGILHKSVVAALKDKVLIDEAIDSASEMKLAQKELHQMGRNLSSIGMRLEGSRYYGLYKKMADAMTELNNALIKEIRKG